MKIPSSLQLFFFGFLGAIMLLLFFGFAATGVWIIWTLKGSLFSWGIAGTTWFLAYMAFQAAETNKNTFREIIDEEHRQITRNILVSHDYIEQ